MSIETMTKLATVTVGSGGAASIEFTNIPQTYTDLLVKVSGRSNNTTTGVDITFNNNATSYTNRRVYGTGASATSDSASTTFVSNTMIVDSSYTANTFGNGEFYIFNYAGSNNKSVSLDGVSENNATTALMMLTASLWSNTEAITSIKLAPNIGNFVQHSTATLYGIKNARKAIIKNDKKSYVTGGTLYSDSSFYYRKFTSTQTLDISGNILSADILVIAGGGHGGTSAASGYYGGGGGAGGLLGFTNAQLYGTIPVVIGAGGATPGSNLRGLPGSNSSLGNLVLGITTALGGGGGGGGSDSSALITANKDGGSGGSGGGGQSAVGTGGLGGGIGGSGTTGQGNNGGNGAGAFQIEPQAGGGGGGAGGAGGNAISAATGGAGGIGSSAYSSWGLATSSGQLSSGVYYFAGGGGGASNGTGGAAGLGGGGAGGGSNGANGTANTGGGGGNGMAGGSGIVIIRYTKEQVL